MYKILDYSLYFRSQNRVLGWTNLILAPPSGFTDTALWQSDSMAFWHIFLWNCTEETQAWQPFFDAKNKEENRSMCHYEIVFWRDRSWQNEEERAHTHTGRERELLTKPDCLCRSHRVNFQWEALNHNHKMYYHLWVWPILELPSICTWSAATTKTIKMFPNQKP